VFLLQHHEGPAPGPSGRNGPRAPARRAATRSRPPVRVHLIGHKLRRPAGVPSRCPAWAGRPAAPGRLAAAAPGRVLALVPSLHAPGQTRSAAPAPLNRLRRPGARPPGWPPTPVYDWAVRRVVPPRPSFLAHQDAAAAVADPVGAAWAPTASRPSSRPKRPGHARPRGGHQLRALAHRHLLPGSTPASVNQRHQERVVLRSALRQSRSSRWRSWPRPAAGGPTPRRRPPPGGGSSRPRPGHRVSRGNAGYRRRRRNLHRRSWSPRWPSASYSS